MEKFTPKADTLKTLRDILVGWQEKTAQYDLLHSLFTDNHDNAPLISRIADDQDRRYESASCVAAMVYLLKGVPFLYQGIEYGLTSAHYEGIDQRFIDECVDEELSLGDFVLTGGEIAAMAVTDAVCCMVPGVLADPECFEDESHFNGLLEYPQYTRPAVWHGREIPAILTSGNHEKVRQWRRKQSLRRTRQRRPDMYEKSK